MVSKSKKKFCVGLLTVLLGLGGFARPVSADGPWGFGAAIDFPQAVGGSKDIIDDGFGFDLNFTYRQPEKIFGLRIDTLYEGFDLDNSVFQRIDQANGGYATVFGGSLSLYMTAPDAEKVQPFLYGGPGLYYEYGQATRDGPAGGYICDPWFGCYPTGYYGVAEVDTTRLGWQGGGGLNILMGASSALTLEVGYVNINNTNRNLEFAPIRIGFRQEF